jgi:hypothetical protein
MMSDVPLFHVTVGNVIKAVGNVIKAVDVNIPGVAVAVLHFSEVDYNPTGDHLKYAAFSLPHNGRRGATTVFRRDVNVIDVPNMLFLREMAVRSTKVGKCWHVGIHIPAGYQTLRAALEQLAGYLLTLDETFVLAGDMNGFAPNVVEILTEKNMNYTITYPGAWSGYGSGDQGQTRKGIDVVVHPVGMQCKFISFLTKDCQSRSNRMMKLLNNIGDDKKDWTNSLREKLAEIGLGTFMNGEEINNDHAITVFDVDGTFIVNASLMGRPNGTSMYWKRPSRVCLECGRVFKDENARRIHQADTDHVQQIPAPCEEDVEEKTKDVARPWTKREAMNAVRPLFPGHVLEALDGMSADWWFKAMQNIKDYRDAAADLFKDGLDNNLINYMVGKHGLIHPSLALNAVQAVLKAKDNIPVKPEVPVEGDKKAEGQYKNAILQWTKACITYNKAVGNLHGELERLRPGLEVISGSEKALKFLRYVFVTLYTKGKTAPCCHLGIHTEGHKWMPDHYTCLVDQMLGGFDFKTAFPLFEVDRENMRQKVKKNKDVFTNAYKKFKNCNSNNNDDDEKESAKKEPTVIDNSRVNGKRAELVTKSFLERYYTKLLGGVVRVFENLYVTGAGGQSFERDFFVVFKGNLIAVVECKASMNYGGVYGLTQLDITRKLFGAGTAVVTTKEGAVVELPMPNADTEFYVISPEKDVKMTLSTVMPTDVLRRKLVFDVLAHVVLKEQDGVGISDKMFDMGVWSITQSFSETVYETEELTFGDEVCTVLRLETTVANKDDGDVLEARLSKMGV